MATYYIDPGVSSGSGTQNDPYGLAQFQAIFNALTGDLGGNAYLFKSGTFGRIPADSGHSGHGLVDTGARNYTLGMYGTGAKPILAGSAIKSGTWTRYSGNVWYIAHTYNDSWYYGGQAANGANTSGAWNPYGKRLTNRSSIANCAATDLTCFYDYNNSLGNGAAIYVNLGGINPNAIVMEYSVVKHLLRREFSVANSGEIVVDSLRLANAYDSNFFFQFGNGSSSFYVYDVDSDQPGSYNASGAQFGVAGRGDRTDWGCIQVIGSAGKGNWLEDFRMERFAGTNAQFAGVTLLYLKGANIYDTYISNCVNGLGLWTDVVDSTFRRGTILNCMFKPDETTTQNTVTTSRQDLQFGIHVPPDPNTASVDGDCYRNEISGYVVANCGYRALNVQSGSDWVINNNTFIAGPKNITENYPSEIVCNFSYYSTGVAPNTTSTSNAKIMANFSNNIVCADEGTTGNGPHLMHVGYTVAGVAKVLGDYNRYYVRGSGAALRLNFNNAQYSSIATWAAASGMDTNSVYLNGDPPIQGYPTFTTESGGNGISVIATSDFEPTNAVDDGANGALVAAGTSWWTGIVTTAPAAPSVSGGTGGTNYYFAVAYISRAGETLASAETTYALLGTETPTVASPVAQDGCTHYNVYCAETSGALKKQNNLPVAIGSNWTMPTNIAGRVTDTNAQRIPSRGPFTNRPEDCNGEPYLSTPDVGGYQHRHLTHPARQLRAGGGY